MKTPGYIITLHSDKATAKTCRKIRKQLKKQLGIKVAVIALKGGGAVVVNQVL